MKAVKSRKRCPRRVACRGLMGVALAALMLGSPWAAAQTESHARISFESGNGMVKGSADADWSFATINTLVLPGDTLWVDKTGMIELEASGGTFVRLADGSKADVTSLPPSGAIRGWIGSFYVQRIKRSTGDMVFSTPVGDVTIDPGSDVRFDIAPNGGTTVSVRWGRATVTAPGGPGVDLLEGQRSYTDPGYLPSEPTPFDKGTEDAFDSWNRERAQSLAVGEEAIPQSIVQASVPAGVADLAPYGQWIDIDNRPCWQPLVADYVPYRYGHWSFVPAYGYCWVDNYPFAYVTSHHGRWFHDTHHGWCWSYGETWGPAWVASFHCGSNFVWCPLDPFDHPVVYSDEFFDVGGIRVGIHGSSFCPADGLLLYGGPTVVCGALTPMIVRGMPRGDINIWNINIHPHERYEHMYGEFHVPVRDFAPRHFIRGPEEMRVAGARGAEGIVHARARVASLETPAMRKEFRPAAAQSRHDVRTPVAQVPRGDARKVALAPTALERVQQRTRAASATTPDAKRDVLKNVTTTRARPELGRTPAASGKVLSRSQVELGNEKKRTRVRSSPETKSVTPPPTTAHPQAVTPRTLSHGPGTTVRPQTEHVRTQMPGASTLKRESPRERTPSVTRERAKSNAPKVSTPAPRPQRVTERAGRSSGPGTTHTESKSDEPPARHVTPHPEKKANTKGNVSETRRGETKNRAEDTNKDRH